MTGNAPTTLADLIAQESGANGVKVGDEISVTFMGDGTFVVEHETGPGF